MRRQSSRSLFVVVLGGSLGALAAEPVRQAPDSSLVMHDVIEDDGGGGGGGGGGWYPANVRCGQDQLNTDQSDGRQRWAKRWQQGNPYGITTWGGRDMRYWNSAFTSEWNDAYIAGYVLYPAYVDPWNMYAPWKGPGAYGSATGTYTGAQIFAVDYSFKPAHVEMDMLCEPGCYTGDQQILLSDGPMGIQEALESGRGDLVTLTPEATFAQLSFMKNRVQHYTADKVEGEQEILTFHTQSGGELRVTTEHPLVMPDGTLKRARDVVAGESLVTKEGKFDLIVEVDKELMMARAYNVRPVTEDLTSNIVVAQGFLSGSQRFQSEYVTEMNRLILRANVPDGVVPAGE